MNNNLDITNANRVEDLKKLYKKKNFNNCFIDNREKIEALKIFAVSIAGSYDIKNGEEAVEKFVAFNNEYIHFPSQNFIDAYSIKIQKMHRFFKYTFSNYYHYSNDGIIRRLNISEDYMQNLKTIISQNEKDIRFEKRMLEEAELLDYAKNVDKKFKNSANKSFYDVEDNDLPFDFD